MDYSENLIAYGAHCSWWDLKTEVATNPLGLPCCPHCGSVLYEMYESEWWNAVDNYTGAEKLGINYRELIEWSQGKCFKNIEFMVEAFKAAKEK